MTVADLISILQKERPTKRVYISRESALVELKDSDVAVPAWGVVVG